MAEDLGTSDKRLEQLKDRIKSATKSQEDPWWKRALNSAQAVALRVVGRSRQRTTKELTGGEIERNHRHATLQHVSHMRSWWGYGLLFLLIAQIVSLNVLMFLSGTDAQSYDSETLQVFIGGTIAQVSAIAVWVVRFVYRDHSKSESSSSDD